MTTCFWLASSLTLTLLQKTFFEVYTGKLCGLLHLDRVPLCLCCCILCSCHQGLSCCVLCGPQCPPRFLLPHSMRFALMFLLLHSVGSPLCYVAAFSAILTKASALPSLQIPLRVLLLHFLQLPPRVLSLYPVHNSPRSPIAAFDSKFIGACDAAICEVAIAAFCCSAGCSEETRHVLHVPSSA